MRLVVLTYRLECVYLVCLQEVTRLVESRALNVSDNVHVVAEHLGEQNFADLCHLRLRESHYWITGLVPVHTTLSFI